MCSCLLSSGLASAVSLTHEPLPPSFCELVSQWYGGGGSCAEVQLIRRACRGGLKLSKGRALMAGRAGPCHVRVSNTIDIVRRMLECRGLLFGGTLGMAGSCLSAV